MRPLFRAVVRSFTAEAFSAKTVTYLRSATTGTEVYVVGTSHISARSAEQVREVIHAIKPDTVLVELCRTRLGILRRREGMGGRDAEDDERHRKLDDLLGGLMGSVKMGGSEISPVEVRRRARDAFQGLFGLGLGMEFVEAIRAAEAIDARLVPFDREQSETLRRLQDIPLTTILGAMTRFMDLKTSPPPFLLDLMMDPSVLTKGVGHLAERFKDRDAVDPLVQWLETVFPEPVDVLIHQRDRFMADGLLSLPPCTKAVAVVGVGHLSGIERLWNEAQLRSR